jgi:hypothetical protein
MKKLSLAIICALVLTGCATAEMSNETSTESSPQPEVDSKAKIESLFLESADFPVAPLRQVTAGINSYVQVFSELLFRNNACDASNELALEISNLQLVASMGSAYEFETSYFAQWVFDAGSEAKANSIYDNFSAEYFNQDCASTHPTLFYEPLPLTDSLPVGFKGQAWAFIIDLDPDLAITRSISTNGRFLMLAGSVTGTEGESSFTPEDSSRVVGLAVRSFSDSELPK